MRLKRIHKIGFVCLTTVALISGLALLAPLLIDEFPRLDNWHVCLIWWGDLAAIWFAFCWAFQRESSDKANLDDLVLESQRTTSSYRFAILILVVSLAADLALTGWGIWAEKIAHERRIPTEAKITDVRTVNWIETIPPFAN